MDEGGRGAVVSGSAVVSDSVVVSGLVSGGGGDAEVAVAKVDAAAAWRERYARLTLCASSPALLRRSVQPHGFTPPSPLPVRQLLIPP